MGLRVLIIAAIATLVLGASSSAIAQQPDMNSYVLRAVEKVARDRAGRGYNINAAFSQNLKYGEGCCVKASRPGETMCVAAAAEVLIEAINLYAAETGDRSSFTKLPMTDWTRGSLSALRAHIFMFRGTGSRGTGHALAIFGIGREKTFPELRPGDFVNFNRTGGSGHAAVFLGYLTPNSTVTPTYAANVVGFRYFSAQGKGKPDAGFAYRNAYFDGHCPAQSSAYLRDCTVIRSNTNRKLLDGGTLLPPAQWRVAQAKAELSRLVGRGIAQQNPGATRAFVDQATKAALEAELEPNLAPFTGETID